MGRLDVRDPVAHRLVDRVLERRGAARDRPDLRAEGVHPEHVRRLPADVLRAHVHDARQVEQGAGGRRRDAVLAGPGLGDDPGLAEPPGEQRLAERVVDLVGAGVGEVLALEVEPQASPAAGRRVRRRAQQAPRGRQGRPRRAGRPGRAASGGRRRRPGARGARPRSAGRGGSRARRARAPRARPSASRARSGRRTSRSMPQRPAASASSRPGVDRGRAGRRRAAGRAGGAGALDEQRDAERVLARALAGDARRLDARGDVDPDRRDRRGGPAPTFAGSRPPARITGTSRATAAASGAADRVPVPPGCGPPAVSSRIRSAPGGEDTSGRSATASAASRRRRRSPARPAGRWSTFQTGRPSAATSVRRLVAGELDASGSTAATISASRASPASAVTATIRGAGAAGARSPGRVAARSAASSSVERARRAGHEVEPDGVGAGADRGLDAGRVGDAADLHERAPAATAGSSGTAPGGDERPRGRGRVGRPHQRLADEGGVEAERAPAGDRRRVADARTRRSTSRSPGTIGAQPDGPLGVDVERPQVAVVDPDDAGPRRRARGRARARRGPRRAARARGRARASTSAREAARRMEHGEEQDRVGAGRAEERELARVDDELLGEDRHATPPRGRPRGRRPSRRTSAARTGREIAAAPPPGRRGPGRRGSSSGPAIAPADGERALDLGDEVQAGPGEAARRRVARRRRRGRGSRALRGATSPASSGSRSAGRRAAISSTTPPRRLRGPGRRRRPATCATVTPASPARAPPRPASASGRDAAPRAAARGAPSPGRRRSSRAASADPRRAGRPRGRRRRAPRPR